MTPKTKFLGVIIDQSLKFDDHIHYIKSKASRGIGILFKTKFLLLQKTLLTMYHAFIYPYFTYCLAVWGTTYPTYLTSLINIQKRAIRLVCGESRYAHSQPLFKRLNLLTFKELYIYSIQIFMYKFHNNQLPDIFLNFFCYNRQVHSHNTRQHELLHIPQSPSIIRAKGMSISNYLARKIDMNCTLVTYKYRLKNYINSNDISSFDHH